MPANLAIAILAAMITLLVGTNRPGSNSRRVARQIESIYKDLNVPLRVIDLAELPAEIFSPESYAEKPPAFKPFSDAILAATGLIVVSPEYNGGIPGILKYFIDMLEFPESFEQRPVCFVGVAAGIWGALRPIEQLQAIFGYRNAFIYPERVFLARINSLLDEKGQLKDPELIQRLRDQATGFISFVEKLKGVQLRRPGRQTRLIDRLAVCSWSLQPATPAQLLEALREIGLHRLQIALDPIRDNPSVWGSFPEEAARSGVELASGMFGCVGEDYTTMETIRQTGGIVPDATWAQNWKNIQGTAALAKQMGLKLVTFHAGFLPHDETDPAYQKLLERLRQVADLFAAQGIELGLETGQESAETLAAFLQKLGRRNVGVNFDPANMILYEKGEPIAALRALGPWLKQVHIKDARKTLVPGAWGEEVVVGTGEVDWTKFFVTLQELGFQGECCIEREAGSQRTADIKSAHVFLERLETRGLAS